MPDSSDKPGAEIRPRIIKCPRCGGDSLYSTDNAHRPFCSASCKNIDFGAWASEAYRVEAQPDPNDPDLPDDGAPPLSH